ncbi:MAG TPA: hypothetical protein VJV04_08035 [Nitrospiraceae bacterium]|nr:hypothetical protein [Nitrospiraceae bacterium]
MSTLFFHEQTAPDAEDGSRLVVRYYYDDISEDILTRSFRLFPKTVQKEFLGNGLIPLADLPADVKAKLKDFLFRRMQEEQRQAS